MSDEGGFWDEELLALQRKYWERWSELNRKAAGPAGPHSRENPWELALEHWWQAVSPAAPEAARDFMARMMDQGRQLFRLAERFSGSGRGEEEVPDWMEVLDQLQAEFDAPDPADTDSGAQDRPAEIPGFGELPFQVWRSLSALMPLAPDLLAELSLTPGGSQAVAERFSPTPGSGAAGQGQARQQRLQSLIREYRGAQQEYRRFFAAVGRESVRRLGDLLRRRSLDGKVIDSARTLYDTWVQTCEEVYAGRVATPEYARLNGRLINASLGIRNHLGAELDGRLGALNLPTRAQVRTLHSRLQENRRETRKLRDRVDALEARLAELGGGALENRPRGKAKNGPGKRAGRKRRGISPVNPIDIRPEKLAEEMADYSRRLGRGLVNLLNAGEVDGGVTPKEAVYREDKMTLYRYRGADGVKPDPIPLLVVYALVNRPYMTDLQEDRSIVRGLLAQSQDLYLVDWGYPDSADCCLTLDDYINGYLDRCVEVVRKRSGRDRINILGICQGGAFSLCYTALNQAKVKNLVTMVTPVDCRTPDNMLSAWVQNIDIDLLVDTLGNVPGELLNWTFLSLKPFSLTGRKYVNMADLLEDEGRLKNFLRMEKWIFDSPDQAGESFRQFVKEFFQNNGLVNGGIRLGGRPVELKNVTCPLLNVYGEQDHLVPPAASRALRGLTGSRDYTEIAFPGGHIGIYVSGRAQKTIPPAIGRWLRAHG